MQRDEPSHEKNQGQDAGGCDATQGGTTVPSGEEDPKAMYERLKQVTPGSSHEDILASLEREMAAIQRSRDIKGT